MPVVRTERGWKGHYICCADCLFGRNTLLEEGNRRLIVSTVGNKYDRKAGKLESLDASNSQFETTVFFARWDAPYWEADVTRQVKVQTDTRIRLLCEDDALADQMHERVVEEMIKNLQDSCAEECCEVNNDD